MTTNQITLERFSITSQKPFAEIMSAIELQVGHPNIAQFYSSVQTAKDDEELQRLVHNAVGPSDLMEFLRLDHGAIVRSEPGQDIGNVMRLLRNPMGTLHGGILCDIADAAIGMAYASNLNEGEPFTTLELKINFFKPIWNADLRATGRVVKQGPHSDPHFRIDTNYSASIPAPPWYPNIWLAYQLFRKEPYDT